MASLKIGQLQSILYRFANTLEANKADPEGLRRLRDLCAMFSGSEAKTVAAFLKVTTKKISAPGSTEVGASIASVLPVLSSFRSLVVELPKTDLNKSLDSLLNVLETYANLPISLFVAMVLSPVEPKSKTKAKAKTATKTNKKGALPVDGGLVDDYVRRLEAALGDDGKFDPLLEELRADKCVGQAEAVAIASRFFGPTARSTSRPKALQRIFERQAKLMEFKTSPSTSGRPAA